MSDQEVLEIVDKLQVLARSKPIDKQRLVTLLRQRGHVVSVTGDGTNDGPALRSDLYINPTIRFSSLWYFLGLPTLVLLWEFQERRLLERRPILSFSTTISPPL